jgi:Uma2 family endonuclease
MTLMVLDAELRDRLIAERQACGSDRYDEVWEGIYMMAPLANNEHQDLQGGLSTAFRLALGWDGPGRVHPGANVSDREKGWNHNYRCPDVVVVMPNGVARDCGTHWYGGPDLCVEIISPDDRARDKFEFYSTVGVRELLLIDRDPWELEVHRLSSGRLDLVGRSNLVHPDVIVSQVLPVSFRLQPGQPRPKIEVVHRDGIQRWLV